MVNLSLPGYELLRTLGTGGMGTVYLARQTSLNRLVAIKLLKRVDDSSAVSRFERESLLAASVAHPNIVFIIDSGSIDGVPYLVQEFVDGPSLADVLAERRLSPAEACELLAPIVAALAHLHQTGILHRDFKPTNVLFDTQQRLRLTDFGLAVCLETGSTLTQTDTIVGTFDYMAPEQRHRLAVDERADQYSLAAVAYEMLTGQRPLGAFKRPSELNPLLPSSVNAILLQALARDPDERFADVTGFFDSLQKSLRPRRANALRKSLPTVALTAVTSAVLTWAITTYEPPRTSTPASIEPVAGSQEAIASVGAARVPSDADSSQSEAATEIEFDELTIVELRQITRDRGLTGYSGLSRSELIDLIQSGGRLKTLPPGWTSEVRIDAVGRKYRWYISPEGKNFRSLPENLENARVGTRPSDFKAGVGNVAQVPDRITEPQ